MKFPLLPASGFVFLLFCASRMPAQCHTEMRGMYTGKPVYVQNPALPNGTTWCTDSLQINGKPVTFEKAAVFEINPANYGLQPCDTMLLDFFHPCGCKPRLVFEMHPPAGNTAFTSVTIDSTGLLQWNVNFDCSGYAPQFYIETEKWGAWHTVSIIPQKTNPTGTYQTVVPLYAGENKFRVIAKGHYSKNQTISQQVVIRSNRKSITWQYDAAKDVITFSDSTGYKIINQKGEIVALHKRALMCDLHGIKSGELRMYYAQEAEPVPVPRRKKKKFVLSLAM